MADFLKVAHVNDIPDPGRQMVEIEDRLVVLLHIDGQFHCIDDVCTHDGGPLGDGPLCGFELACPRHGARFDVRSGKALSMPATQDTQVHEVRVVDEDVFVKLNSHVA